jgi:hypothetical protein
MNSDRIKEIQEATAYPNSLSVKQALLQVWNECAQEYASQFTAQVSDEDIEKMAENFAQTCLFSSHHIYDKRSVKEGFMAGMRTRTEPQAKPCPNDKSECYRSIVDGCEGCEKSEQPKQAEAVCPNCGNNENTYSLGYSCRACHCDF